MTESNRNFRGDCPDAGGCSSRLYAILFSRNTPSGRRGTLPDLVLPYKTQVLDQPPEQVVANTTLSETVAQLINCWDNMCPEERAVLTALVWANSSDVQNEPKALGWCNRNIFSSIALSGQLKFLTASSGRDTTPGVNGTDFKGIEAAKQKLAAKV